MPRIRCHYMDCIFIDEGHCGAAAVEIDPDTGCATYTQTENGITDDDWEGNDIDDWDSEGDDDDDLWLDDDDDL